MNKPDQDRNKKSDWDKDDRDKSNGYGFDEDRDRQKTRIGVSNKILHRQVDKLTYEFNKLSQIDPKYWKSLDRNEKYLEASTRERAHDFYLFLSMCGNYVIDFILFHSIVKYMLQIGTPNCPEIILTIIAVIFPIFYLFGELELNHKICTAKKNMDSTDLDRGAKIWFVFWCVLGALYALFPSASFAYVMHVAQEETSQSPLFIIILAILGIVIHTIVIFGGQGVADFKTRSLAKWGHGWLARSWYKQRRKTQLAVNLICKASQHHTESIGHEFSRELMLKQIAPNVSKMIRFFDEEFDSLHPLDRKLGEPQKLVYQFGYRRNRRDDDNDLHNPQ
jgi:hypothetical protein